MLARWLLACVALGFGACAFAQADDVEVKKTAKAKAGECQNALLKGDYDKLIDLTHPKVVEGVGGRKKMTEVLVEGVTDLKAKGIAFKSVTMQEPTDPIPVGKGIYLLVPFTLEITVPGGRLTSKSALLGISSDGGITWVFADTAPGRDAMKKVFTDLPDKLEFPKKEPPVFTKD